MRKNDTSFSWLFDPAVALVLLSRLPVPPLPASAFERQAQATWAFPLAGLAIGILSAGTAAFGLALELSAWVAAGLALTVQVVVTGALHEDGLADTADGFWGGVTQERRLEIMADSRVGTYGVLALVLSVGLRWGALASVLDHGVVWLIALAVVSRAGLSVMMHVLPVARPGGLSDRVGPPSASVVAASVLLGLALSVIIAGTLAAALVLATLLALAATGFIAWRKIGGQTGDVLGAAQQMAEIGCLLALAALL